MNTKCVIYSFLILPTNSCTLWSLFWTESSICPFLPIPIIYKVAQPSLPLTGPLHHPRSGLQSYAYPLSIRQPQDIRASPSLIFSVTFTGMFWSEFRRKPFISDCTASLSLPLAFFLLLTYIFLPTSPSGKKEQTPTNNNGFLGVSKSPDLMVTNLGLSARSVLLSSKSQP